MGKVALRHLAVLLALILLLPSVLRGEEEPGASEPTFEAQVNAAIDKGVAWLRSRQREDGSWGPCVSGGQTYDGKPIDPVCYHTGPTSFALYTLLSCDVPRRDRCVKSGLKWLRRMEKSEHRFSSYETSSLILMLAAMYDTGDPVRTARNPQNKPRGSAFRKSDWTWLHERVGYLIGPTGCRRGDGGWGYWPRGTHQDLSATQFALLSLRAAVRAGYPVEAVCPTVWREALEFTSTLQTPSGEFRYTPPEKWSAGMTAAGLANLLICRERLDALELEVPGGADERIDSAFKALGAVYRANTNVGESADQRPIYHYCYLYAVERVGAVSGKHLIGSTPWYRSGAEFLLSRQHVDGQWNDTSCMAPTDVLGTCFALLFLKKATPPAVVTGGSD